MRSNKKTCKQPKKQQQKQQQISNIESNKPKSKIWGFISIYNFIHNVTKDIITFFDDMGS
jgi:hypothetical protein